MKNLAFLSLGIVLLLSAAAGASECRWFNDGYYHYSICAPGDWKKSYREDGDRHYLAFRPGKAATEISVTASPADGESKQEGSGWKKWIPRGTGSGFRKIIETKELAAGDNVTVKIVVFDYYYRGVRMLQRTMVSRYGDNSLVIECRAPLHSFSKYTDLFNTVMSSVDYTGKMTGDAMAEPGEQKEVAHRQAEPKKAVEPKKKAEPKKRPVIVKRKEPEPDSSLLKQKKEKEDLSILKPEIVEEDSSAEKPREGKPAGSLNNKGEAEPAGVMKKGDEEVTDVDSVEDPEAKKVIENELNTLQDMERRGLIEKVEEEK